MPLHDWTNERGWDSLHMLWQHSLLQWVQPRLPQGYRAYLAGVPALTIDSNSGRPDLGVRTWNPPAEANGTGSELLPDEEAVATLALEPGRIVQIDYHGQLIAAIEIVSPRNKDRPDSRERYSGRYAGYLHNAVHLLLIDVLPKPYGFSFADVIAASAGLKQPPCPVPYAVSYRVGEVVPEGTLLARWVRPLAVGAALPTIPLALNVHQSVPIDLEHTYREAARLLYLE